MEIKKPSPADKTTGERKSEKIRNIVFGIVVSANILLLADFSKLNLEMKNLRDEYEQQLEENEKYNTELNETLHLLKTILENLN